MKSKKDILIWWLDEVLPFMDKRGEWWITYVSAELPLELLSNYKSYVWRSLWSQVHCNDRI